MPLEDYLSDRETISSFCPPLAASMGISRTLAPRNFTLLMFGANVIKFFLGAYAIFSIYRGKDRSEPTAERIEVTGSVIQQARKLIDLLNTESYIAFDKTTDQPNQAKYPRRALQEAVVNAIAHRDYESDQPIRVTVFTDRIEIISPGALPSAVDPEKFREGKATPFWRNQTLAYFFNKLQLAQAEGQGIPTIIRTMSEEGCPPPVFEVSSESVKCTLPAHPRHALMRELTSIESKIILGNHEEAVSQLEQLLESDPYNFRCIELYCEVNNILGTQSRVLTFYRNNNIEPTKINAGTLLVLGETLSQIKDSQAAQATAKHLLSRAIMNRLEEHELKRVVTSFRKLKDDEKAIAIIDDAIKKNPNFANSSILRDIAARSRIDLAKKCIETGRNAAIGSHIRRRAWEQCREYLAHAERDLVIAIEHAKDDVEQDFSQRNMEFLKHMQDISRKPDRAITKPRSSKPSRGPASRHRTK